MQFPSSYPLRSNSNSPTSHVINKEKTAKIWKYKIVINTNFSSVFLVLVKTPKQQKIILSLGYHYLPQLCGSPGKTASFLWFLNCLGIFLFLARDPISLLQCLNAVGLQSLKFEFLCFCHYQRCIPRKNLVRSG